MRVILKNADFIKEAESVLTSPLMTPNGDIRQDFIYSSSRFSHWLGLRFEEVLAQFPDWKKTGPILLGSWARGELSLKSDLDVLFCGEEASVAALVQFLNEKGYKLRSRMPQDMNDWTANVEAFDVLALLKAKPLTTEAASLLIQQQKVILHKRKTYAKKLLKAIVSERQLRAHRFDSITNFLEPNIKYGPGGLRDIEQGLQVYELFADKIKNPFHTLNVLKYYKNYLLNIRQKLHLLGYSDILAGTSQIDISQWLGFKGQKEFMSDLQKGLSRVHFYSNWLIEAALSSDDKLEQIENSKINSPAHCFNSLYADSSVLMQKKVRESMDSVFGDLPKSKLYKFNGRALQKMLSSQTSDATLVALFQSRLIDKMLPSFKHLVGYSQHDQYHRYTADAHILQACREGKRIQAEAKNLLALKSVHAKLKPNDWKVLQWTCLYHDLAKGLNSSEHSSLGVSIVKNDFKKMGIDKKTSEEVAWMVENHLELSIAAFRKNAQSLSLWQELKEKGVTGARLYRLAVFTAIDIRATNPEAWSEWKSKLLMSLVQNLESPSTTKYLQLLKHSKQANLEIDPQFFESLDPLLVASIAPKIIVADLKNIQTHENDLGMTIIKVNSKNTWIRVHTKNDRTGFLAEIVSQFYSLGIGVRHASIHSFDKIGVYDWFLIQTNKKPEMLSRLLFLDKNQSRKIPDVQFSQIEMMSADQHEWVLSFKGHDQAGLLAAATQALADLNIGIKFAKVHTWGRQIEDVFVLKPFGDPQELVAQLKAKFKIS